MFYVIYPYKRVSSWICKYYSKKPIKLIRHMCFGLAYNRNNIPHVYQFSWGSVIYIRGADGLLMYPRFKLYTSFSQWVKDMRG